MNGIRKKLCLFFALVLSLNLFLSASAKYFNDIPVSHWAFDEINVVSDNGIMNGTSPNYFSPDDNVDKGMLMYILYTIAGRPETTYTYIPDVSSTQYYALAVSWALNNRIATLDDSGYFCPVNNVTREQCVTFLARYCNERDYNSDNDYSSYTDFNMISDYAVSAFKWAIDKKIVSGTRSNSNLYLYPKNNISRAELSSIIARYIRNVEGFTQKDIFSFNNSSNINGFTTGGYMLTDSDYQILINKINDTYPPKSDFMNNRITREEVLDLVQSKINSNVKSDLSFGYCAVLGLHKYGKVNLLNCDTDAKNISEIALSETVVSKINYYSLVGDILQYDYVVFDYAVYYGDYSNKFKKAAVKGWHILTYYDNGVPYSLILTGRHNGDNYIYDAYDPLNCDELIIECKKNTCNIKKNNSVIGNITRYQLFDIQSVFNSFDIDGDYNNIIQ